MRVYLDRSILMKIEEKRVHENQTVQDILREILGIEKEAPKPKPLKDFRRFKMGESEVYDFDNVDDYWTFWEGYKEHRYRHRNKKQFKEQLKVINGERHIITVTRIE